MAAPSKTGQLPLVANRWEPFVYAIDFESLDWSGATFIAQVRRTRDTSETPFADLATVGSITTQGIKIVGVTSTDGVPTTSISMRINETTMEAMPEPAEIGDDIVFWWDMQVTPSGDDKTRILEGTFTVHAGATH